MTILALLQAVPSIIAAGVAIAGAAAAISQWWRNRNTTTALTAANQTAAGMIAAAELVPQTPEIVEFKRVAQMIQTQTGLELKKAAGLVGATKAVLVSQGLGNKTKNEATVNNIAVVADAIMQSEKIRAERSGVSLELPSIGGKP